MWLHKFKPHLSFPLQAISSVPLFCFRLDTLVLHLIEIVTGHFLLLMRVYVFLLQNTQKKRGVRPNNKPDKKLCTQVTHTHTHRFIPCRLNLTATCLILTLTLTLTLTQTWSYLNLKPSFYPKMQWFTLWGLPFCPHMVGKSPQCRGESQQCDCVVRFMSPQCE